MQPVEAKILLKGLCGSAEGEITDVVTDSRRVVPGCVFVCFEGARVDGHSFAAGAVEKGAAYILALHPVEGVPPEKTILVEDPALAMVAMAANYRALFRPRMIGVTGSVGKTTTKEFCYAVLSAFGTALKTEGNQNNEIGLPNTLFRLDEATEYAVVEMGMSALGEIARLVRTARPAAGIITMIGVSHLENLGSRENILKAKLEICQGLPDGAPLVLNGDDALLRGAALPHRLRPVWFALKDPASDVRAVDIRDTAAGTAFTLADAEHGRFEVCIPTTGLHTVYDALAAYAAATRLGLDPARAAAALANYQTTGMRQNLAVHGGVTFIEDCYNASPDSMRAALGILASRTPGAGGRRIAVLGDMLELGAVSEAAHRDTGTLAGETADIVLAVGPLSAALAEAARKKCAATLYCQNTGEVVEYLRSNLRPGDIVLAKASHAMGFEQMLTALYAVLPTT